jgi:hypothetical protein
MSFWQQCVVGLLLNLIPREKRLFLTTTLRNLEQAQQSAEIEPETTHGHYTPKIPYEESKFRICIVRER